MNIPRITVSATNVELTPAIYDLISRRLTPLGRLLIYEGDVNINVVLRYNPTTFGGMYFVSVRLKTDRNSYMAVASKAHLARAIIAAKDMLRQSISKGASVSDTSLLEAAKTIKQAYTLTL